MKKDVGSRKKVYITVILVLLVVAGGVLIVYGESIFEKYNQREGTGGIPGSTEENKLIGLQYIFTVCHHEKTEYVSTLPPEISAAMNLNTTVPTEDRDAMDLVLPEGWYFAEFDGQKIFTFVGELCPDCQHHYYLGNHEGKIAKFRGIPPRGVLIEDLEIEVKDINKEILDEGVIFHNNDEMIELLEDFSS